MVFPESLKLIVFLLPFLVNRFLKLLENLLVSFNLVRLFFKLLLRFFRAFLYLPPIFFYFLRSLLEHLNQLG